MADTIELVPLAEIDDAALPRDRTALQAEPLRELRDSILKSGLRQPVELFPLERVEAFIAAHLSARTYPHLRALPFDAGLMQPLANALARAAEPLPAPFDLEAERIGQYGKGRLDASEYRYAIQLLQLRPGLALATMFLRGFLEMWAHALKEASRGSLNAGPRKDNPTGRSSPVNPAGTIRSGNPVRLAMFHGEGGPPPPPPGDAASSAGRRGDVG